MEEVSRGPELFEIARDTCLALLTTQHVGRVVLPGPDPYVVPVNYGTVGHAIVFRSDPGPRIEAIVGRRVVFEVDMYDDRTQSGWSVIVRGTAADVSDDVPAEDAIGAGAWMTVASWAPGPKSCWIRVAAEEVTGRLLRGEVRPSWVSDRGYL